MLYENGKYLSDAVQPEYCDVYFWCFSTFIYPQLQSIPTLDNSFCSREIVRFQPRTLSKINKHAYKRRGLYPRAHITGVEIDCLQSAFSRKIRLVLISASAIANQTLRYTPSFIAARGFTARRSSAWVSRAVSYYCTLLIKVFPANKYKLPKFS